MGSGGTGAGGAGGGGYSPGGASGGLNNFGNYGGGIDTGYSGLGRHDTSYGGVRQTSANTNYYKAPSGYQVVFRKGEPTLVRTTAKAPIDQGTSTWGSGRGPK